MLSMLLPLLSSIAGKVAGNLFPDPADKAKADAAQQQFVLGLMEHADAIEQSAAEIVKAEAASGNWLASSWRPITMLVFVSLIVARWFGYAAPGMSEAEILSLWDIVKLGLGGYVVGRSAEKVLPQVIAALKK
jgi:Holin of 3TMs, for gene-transfer release